MHLLGLTWKRKLGMLNLSFFASILQLMGRHWLQKLSTRRYHAVRAFHSIASYGMESMEVYIFSPWGLEGAALQPVRCTKRISLTMQRTWIMNRNLLRLSFEWFHARINCLRSNTGILSVVAVAAAETSGVLAARDHCPGEDLWKEAHCQSALSKHIFQQFVLLRAWGTRHLCLVWKT